MEANWSQGAMGQETALDALNEIAGTKRQVGERSKAPTGYYALLGFAVGLDIFAISQPLPWIFIWLLPAFALLGFSVAWYRDQVGTWSRGKLNDPSSWSFWLMAVVAAVAILVAAMVHTTTAGLVAGAIAFVSWAILGPIWDRAYQRQVSERE